MNQKKSAENKNEADVDTNGSDEKLNDSEEGTTGSSKNTVNSSEDETGSSKNTVSSSEDTDSSSKTTVNPDEGKDGSDNNSTGYDKNPENSNGNTTTPNENLNNSQDDSEDSEETSNNANGELKESKENSNQVNGENSGSVVTDEIVNDDEQYMLTSLEGDSETDLADTSKSSETNMSNCDYYYYYTDSKDGEGSEDSEEEIKYCESTDIQSTIAEAEKKAEEIEGKNLVIKINKNINLSSTMTFSKKLNYTIDLQGHELTIDEGLRFIDVEKDANVTVKNGELKNGDSTKYKQDPVNDPLGIQAYLKSQGIVYCTGGTLTIDKLTIEGNKTNSNGAVYINGGTLNANNCKIKNNTATNGGGVYLSNNAKCNIKDCTIEGNNQRGKSDKMSGGSGIYVSNSCLNADKLNVISNGCNCETICGGIFIQNNIEYTVTLKDSLIANNKGCVDPAGALAAGMTIKGGTVTLQNTVIKNNTGHDCGGVGIYPYNADIEFNMEGGAIYNNTADSEYYNGDINTNAFAHDIIIEGASKHTAGISMPAANEMKDDNANDIVFSDYSWNCYGSDNEYALEKETTEIELDIPKGNGEEYLYTASALKNRVVAKNPKKEGEYNTIAEAIEAAEDGDTIILIAGENDRTAHTVNEEVTISDKKSIIIDLNGRTWNSGNNSKKAFTINNEETDITITGDGSIPEIDYEKGSLTLNSSANIGKIYLGNDKTVKLGKDFPIDSKKATFTFVIDNEYLETLDENDIVLITGTKDNLNEIIKNIEIVDVDNLVTIIKDKSGNIAAHKIKALFIDGKKGNDSNNGLTLESQVKTFKKINEILNNNDSNYEAVFVTDTVTISDEETTLSLSKDIPVCRYSKFGGYLIDIANNATLENITIDGQGDKVEAKNALIKVDSGATLNIKKGTKLTNNNHMTYSSVEEAGGAIYCQGTINMYDGEISGNTSWYGGGIELRGTNAKMKMEGGSVKNNKVLSLDSPHYSAGGGICAMDGASLTMDGGEVTGNTSTGTSGIGGGIMIGDRTQIFSTTLTKSMFTMNGGKVSNNSTALDGGGIYIQSSSEGRINAGEISYNKCNGSIVLIGGEGDFGGGGIYVNGKRGDGTNVGKLYLKNAYISGNTSDLHSGSAIAGCGTSTVIIHPEGATICNNSDSGSQIYVDNSEETGYGNIAEINISQYATGDGINHWRNIDNDEELTYADLTNLEDDEKLDITNTTAENLDTEGALSTVKIIGNTSEKRGGGIGTNGYVEIGEKEIKTDITVTKKWQDGKDNENNRPASIEVELYANDSLKQTVKLTKEKDWTYTFENLDKYTSNDEKITYSIKEKDVNGYFSVVDGYDITNIITTSITVNKKWNDGNNKYKTRPDSITVHLYADGEELESQDITTTNDVSYTFENLPKYNESGDEVEYTIKEDEVAGYSSFIDEYAITNTLLTSVTGTKTWYDGNDKYGERPDSITVQLLKNGKVIKSQDITAENDWSYTFEDLPRFDESGNEIIYTIDEENVDNYIKKVDGYNLINTYYIDIKGTKTWDDKNDQDGKRPDSITVHLLVDGKEEKSVEVTEETGWKYSFTGLPKYNGNEEIEYAIDEVEVEGYIKKVEGYDLTNTHTPETIEIKGTKTWDDNNNQDGKRPKKITIYLYADGVQVAFKEISGEETNEWEYSFTDLPRYSNGHEIVYKVDEGEVKNYTKEIDKYDITNTHTPETIVIGGTKTWKDNDNQDGKRPEKIIVNLLANGEKVDSKEVTEKDEWKYVFRGLPKYSKGQEIRYTIDEEVVADYTKEVDGYNVTNTHTPETVDISGIKTWNDNEDQDGKRPDKITVHLFAGEDEIASKDVTEADEWTYSFTNLPKYSAGQEINYTIKEDEVDDYTTEIDGYNITNTHIPETVDIDGTKTWNDNNNQDGKRPEKITVYLLADGKQKDSREITEADGWAYSFEGLPKYSEGQEIEYTVDEGEVENYTKEIIGYNITNTHIPETVVIGGTKTWNDNEDQDGKRPEKIIVNLFANGAKVDSREVTEADEWSYLFTGLPKYSEGQEIKYTIDEEIVAEYTKEVDGYNVTNTHIPETIDISGTKTWNDNENQDGKRPDSIIVYLLANGEKVDSKEITEADEWKYLFTGLPKYSKGQEITYTIDEEVVADYAKEIDGYNLINTHIPKDIDEDEGIDENEDINTKPEAPNEYPKTGDNILMNITVWLISIVTGIVIIKKEIFN